MACDLDVYLRAIFTAGRNCTSDFLYPTSSVVERHISTILQDILSILTHLHSSLAPSAWSLWPLRLPVPSVLVMPGLCRKKACTIMHMSKFASLSPICSHFSSFVHFGELIESFVQLPLFSV